MGADSIGVGCRFSQRGETASESVEPRRRDNRKSIIEEVQVQLEIEECEDVESLPSPAIPYLPPADDNDGVRAPSATDELGLDRLAQLRMAA